MPHPKLLPMHRSVQSFGRHQPAVRLAVAATAPWSFSPSPAPTPTQPHPPPYAQRRAELLEELTCSMPYLASCHHLDPSPPTPYHPLHSTPPPSLCTGACRATRGAGAKQTTACWLLTCLHAKSYLAPSGFPLAPLLPTPLPVHRSVQSCRRRWYEANHCLLATQLPA